MSKGFLGRWWKGTKDVAVSPLGGLQTSIIINFFILFGCFYGSYQTKVSGAFGVFSLILFCVGCLTLYNWVLSIRQYRSVRGISKVFKDLENKDGDK